MFRSIKNFNAYNSVILANIQDNVIGEPPVYDILFFVIKSDVKKVCLVVVNDVHLCLPLSIEYIYGNGYNPIFFDKVKHFHSLLFIILIVTILLEIINLGFSYPSVLSIVSPEFV
ncbi:hypothetical protein KsCSTR_14160 [Candidatus Kuenenia stuttgartiensis]|uniref:Uncharacterized protein n=1 Tax=Kuenenia stuttgartiensis TaxID=174633 RepID=Q1Q181_KUEST|nr:hypothetical protein KsCSTR_14160 [Candidatus Kuenenia stuttgartiensis]CAJ73767.1 unknown protein [Candidatus Kuenenia stuttgartiensis]